MMRFGQRFLFNDLFAIELSIPKLQPQPFRHVVYRRAHSASGRLRIGIAIEFLHPLAVNQHMWQRFVSPRDEIGVTRTGRNHAEWLEQLFLTKRFPFGAVRFCRRNSGFGHAETRVGGTRTKTAVRMLVPKTM